MCGRQNGGAVCGSVSRPRSIAPHEGVFIKLSDQQIARFYNAALAAAVWNSAARQLASEHGTSTSFNARAFALLNIWPMSRATSTRADLWGFHFRFESGSRRSPGGQQVDSYIVSHMAAPAVDKKTERQTDEP